MMFRYKFGKILRQHWFNIKSSLWFLPTLMAVSSVGLALLLIVLDQKVSYDSKGFEWLLYNGHIEGARAVLTTIASSMITIVAVTFSITLVALTMASSQFGPRMLRNFISDRSNQFVIGTFISSFIYPLIILLYSRASKDEDVFVLQISVIVAFLLALLSLAVLIYFIHHVSVSIQADYVVRLSYQEFIKAMPTSLCDVGARGVEESGDEAREKFRRDNKEVTEVNFDSPGYVQSVDYLQSEKLAAQEDLAFEWLVRPGDFANIFQPFVRVYHNSPLKKDIKEQLRGMILTGYQRTPNQDLLFSLRKIAEVGIRALSPGINDPHTAVTCIQWVGAALSEIARREFKAEVLKDRNGNSRVIITHIGYQKIVETCFDELLLYGSNNLHVMHHLLHTVLLPLCHTRDRNLHRLLKVKAKMIYDCAVKNNEGQDLLQLEMIYREIGQFTMDGPQSS